MKVFLIGLLTLGSFFAYANNDGDKGVLCRGICRYSQKMSFNDNLFTSVSGGALHQDASIVLSSFQSSRKRAIRDLESRCSLAEEGNMNYILKDNNGEYVLRNGTRITLSDDLPKDKSEVCWEVEFNSEIKKAISINPEEIGNVTISGFKR